MRRAVPLEFNDMKTLAQQGFTLVELLVTVAVAAAVLTAGVPSFSELVQNNRMTAHVNEFVADVNLARSEAIKRGETMVLCKRNSNATDCDDSSEWVEGWLVFADENEDGSVSAGEDIVRVHGTLMGLSSVHFMLPRLTYEATGFLRRQGQSCSSNPDCRLTFCDSRGVDKAKGLQLSSTGRLSVVTSDLTCP
jgi:type IV fimbrial biogenesis protein FimT